MNAKNNQFCHCQKKEKEKEEIMENNSLKTTEKPLTRPITNNSNYYKNGN